MFKMRLKIFKQIEERENKDKVYQALDTLKKAKPLKIWEFIEQKAEEDSKNYLQNNNLKYSSEEFQKKKKEFSMSLRTVKKILKNLHETNLVNHERGGIYSLNESINKFLLFPNYFGTDMIYSIGNFFPRTVEKSLEEFVNRYGLFMIFVFVQLLSYRNNKNENENGNRNGNESTYTDYDIESWLEDAIPLKLMFDLFRTLYLNDNKEEEEKENTTYNNLKILNGLNKIMEIKYPILYKEFNDKMKENIKVTQIIEERRKKSEEIEARLHDFYEVMERRKSWNEYKNKTSKFVIPPMDGIRVYARAVPKNWKEQIAKLEKDSD